MKKKQDKLNLNYLTIKPSKQEQQELAKAILYLDAPLRYKRLKSGKYKVSCNKCFNTYTVTAEQFKQIRSSKLCAHCFSEFSRSSTIQEQIYVDYVSKEKQEKGHYIENGYYMVIKDKLGCNPKVLECDHVLYHDGNNLYRRNVVRNMYCLSRTSTNGWKKVSKYTDYLGYTHKYYWIKEKIDSIQFKTKKSLYESYFLNELELKDNQKKLVMDNLFNRNQIKFIKLFNLKKKEDLYKYRTYIARNDTDIWALNIIDKEIELNEYYLHYLWKNNIRLGDFIDYVEQCKILNVKLDKPKNFCEKHSEYSKMIVWLKDKTEEENVKKRYKKYSKYIYKSKDIEIKPFKSVKQIIACGEKLNNCIGSYVSDYAKGETKIFYLIEKGKLSAAIEIDKGVLIQARTKNNESCTKKQKYHIKKWLEKNGWKYA